MAQVVLRRLALWSVPGMSRLYVEPARGRMENSPNVWAKGRWSEACSAILSIEFASSVAPFPKVAWAFLSRLTPQAL